MGGEAGSRGLPIGQSAGPDTPSKERTVKNILVAYDGGEPARRALETAIDLAKQFDGSLGISSA